jgi:hypothetical protein
VSIVSSANSGPDVFYALCSVAEAKDIATARFGAWEFLHDDSPGFTEPVEKMLDKPVVPIGSAPGTPPTHYICAWHADKRQVDRMNSRLKSRREAGNPIPLTVYQSDEPIIQGAGYKDAIALHADKSLAKLGLMRA